jgi:hypothetical protein
MCSDRLNLEPGRAEITGGARRYRLPPNEAREREFGCRLEVVRAEQRE